MKLGRYIKRHRLKLGISLQELGNEAGVSKQALSQIELGQVGVNILTLYNLCKVLRCSYKQAIMLLTDDMVKGRVGPKAREKEKQ